MYEQIIERLKNLNFNSIEAQIYIMLIKYNELNGSQIAKKINASRSSVYSALSNLYNRGVVCLIPGNTNVYKAEKPEVLIENMKNDFENNTSILKEQLKKLKNYDEDNKYYNLNGTKNFINKVKELLNKAEKEVYINTCLDLNIFKKEICKLLEKGVRIVVFTYSDMDIGDLPVELYKHHIDRNIDNSQNEEIRLMIVVDLKHTLICSSNKDNLEMTGTFTQDNLLANIVAEHIHHDIYLLKLKEKYNQELIDDSVKLNSSLEKKLSLEYIKK